MNLLLCEIPCQKGDNTLSYMTDERVCAIIYWPSSPHVLSVLPCGSRADFADHISQVWQEGTLKGDCPTEGVKKSIFPLKCFVLIGWLVGWWLWCKINMGTEFRDFWGLPYSDSNSAKHVVELFFSQHQVAGLFQCRSECLPSYLGQAKVRDSCRTRPKWEITAGVGPSQGHLWEQAWATNLLCNRPETANYARADPKQRPQWEEPQVSNLHGSRPEWHPGLQSNLQNHWVTSRNTEWPWRDWHHGPHCTKRRKYLNLGFIGSWKVDHETHTASIILNQRKIWVDK